MGMTSVVMATYNGAAFVEAQLRSLLAQSVPPAELVVADDRSADGTLAIVEAALARAPFPVRVARNAERKGYRRNFVEAASRAEAPLVAFCDQDDVWRPDKIARMEAALADPGVMLAYHNASIMDHGRAGGGRLYGPGGGTRRSESALADPWSFSLGFTQVFRRELTVHAPLQALSRDFLFPREPLAHDQWFFFLAASFGRVAFVDEDLVAYRQHAANVFSAVDRGRARGLGVFRATLDHSRGQLEARRLSVLSKAEVFRRIAADAATPPERRVRATALAHHHEDLARYYAARVAAYGRGAGKASAWLGLMAARRRLAAQGLAYRPQHAARDLACGLILGRFAASPRGPIAST